MDQKKAIYFKKRNWTFFGPKSDQQVIPDCNKKGRFNFFIHDEYTWKIIKIV